MNGKNITDVRHTVDERGELADIVSSTKHAAEFRD
jgi:hypothetical protein